MFIYLKMLKNDIRQLVGLLKILLFKFFPSLIIPLIFALSVILIFPVFTPSLRNLPTSIVVESYLKVFTKHTVVRVLSPHCFICLCIFLSVTQIIG
jgi:hypothetical protein